MAISALWSSNARPLPALNKSSTSGASIKAAALRVLRSLDPVSLDVLSGMQAEGEGMAALSASGSEMAEKVLTHIN